MEFQRFRSGDYRSVRQILLDVYVEVYRKTLSEPFTSLDEFERRLDRYVESSGWDCVLGREGDQVAGYAFGYSLRPDASWWHGMITPVDDEDLVETGTRTFALNEIMVRDQWRGTGVARDIHDRLIAGRVEQRSTLLVEQSHPKVRLRYEAWGYRWFAAIRPEVPHAPILDCMILELRGDAMISDSRNRTESQPVPGDESGCSGSASIRVAPDRDRGVQE